MANNILSKLTVWIAANTSGFDKSLGKTQSKLSTFTNGVGALNGQLKGLIAGFGLYEVGRQIIKTTSEFQKFSAVLTNSLGSESASQKALNQIKDFAASTPFSVQELTGSFVKLVNQGFIPTTNELRKLGDLAASTGKGFDQLTEAIIDAQVGEFERLKEFGIRAQKQGDKVTFSFKGVKKQVDFTAESIQGYVLSLGDAIGVSGSMDAISKTLGGRISNLGDAWDGLMVAMGESSSGPLFATVESLTNIVKALTDFRSEMALVGQALSPFHDLSDVSKKTLDYLLKTSEVAAVIEPFAKQSDVEFVKDYNKNLQQFTDTFLKQGESIEDIRVLWLHYVKSRSAAAQADADANSDKRKKDFDDYISKIKEQASELAKLERLKVGVTALRTGVTKPDDITGDFNTGSGVFAEQANRISVVMDGLNKKLQINSNAWAIWQSQVTARAQIVAEAMEAHEKKTNHLAEVAETIGGAMGDVFGSLATNQENLLQVMLRATEQIINMFLKQSIAAMIATAMRDPSTPFPFAKIAIAAAGIGAVNALFGKIGSGGGVGGRATSAPGRTPSETQQHSFRIRGYELATLGDKEDYRRSRLG